MPLYFNSRCFLIMENSFATRLKQLRQQKGLSQSDLGDLVKVHYTHIGKYERGESSPSLDTLILLAECLNVTIDYLARGNEENAAVASIADRDLLQMFQATEKLAPEEKETIKKFLDAFLMKQKLKEQLIS